MPRPLQGLAGRLTATVFRQTRPAPVLTGFLPANLADLTVLTRVPGCTGVFTDPGGVQFFRPHPEPELSP